jgi:hypothetical protein
MSLPANNISQQLFFKQLPNCESNNPAPCCSRELSLENWYKSAPQNIWNTVSNYQGGPPFSACTDDAFVKQCFLSQYYNYLSKNNTL